MNKYTRDTVLSQHGYQWRDTTPADAKLGPNGLTMPPTPEWLVMYDPEDGEEIPIIAFTHSGGESRALAIADTQKHAERIAQKLLDLEAQKETESSGYTGNFLRQ